MIAGLDILPPLCMGCGSPIHDQFILRVSPDLSWHAACLKVSNRLYNHAHHVYCMCTLSKKKLNCCNNTESVTARMDATVYVRLLLTYCIFLVQNPGKHRCICSRRDRLGFYAEIQIIFGVVYIVNNEQYIVPCSIISVSHHHLYSLHIMLLEIIKIMCYFSLPLARINYLHFNL